MHLTDEQIQNIFGNMTDADLSCLADNLLRIAKIATNKLLLLQLEKRLVHLEKMTGVHKSIQDQDDDRNHREKKWPSLNVEAENG